MKDEDTFFSIDAKTLLEMSQEDVMELDNPGYKERIKNRKWGPWKFDKDTMVLIHDIGKEIDIERYDKSSEMLDDIFRVFNCSWVTKDDIWFLLLAYREIFNPQACLCSYGGDHRINPTAMIERFIERTQMSRKESD
jgi:hypothetical protein